MKIFLSALENQHIPKPNSPLAPYLVQQGIHMRWNLCSYYYGRNNLPVCEYIRDNSDEMLVDSGAHSFQKGARVDWKAYTHQYAAFIRAFDTPNVIGYFEMDVDNVLGYPRVQTLRDILLTESGHPSKIIPVWHRGRGIKDFQTMCQERTGCIAAITGFKNEDIIDEQYPMFLKYAHAQGTKLHCLGMTRKDILERVPFDYTDSSSWVQHSLYGRIESNHVSRATSRVHRHDVLTMNYELGQEMQRHFYNKWQTISKD